MPKAPSRTVFREDASARLWAQLPVTAPTGKVRVKRRSHFAEYGMPVAACSGPLAPADYVEWQIGYDLPAEPENATVTSLSGRTFRSLKDEDKYPFELSELLFHARRFGFVADDAVKDLAASVESVADADLLDVRADMAVLRSHPVETAVNGVPFWKMEVRYPLLVHRFGNYEILAEVTNREKQRGVGLQPMLYVCIPLANLAFDEPPFGRAARPKETCRWNVGAAEAPLLLELFRIFGMLTARHRHDTLAILRALFPETLPQPSTP